MSEINDWVIVGQFGKVHGIKGFITLHSFTEPRDNILEYKPWFMLLNKQWQPIDLSKIEVNNKHILVKVEGFTEREQASELTHVQVGIKKTQLPTLPKGEFYWNELIGMQVHNTEGTALGFVKEILATGANDVLIIEGERRYLVPYLLDLYIIAIDAEQRAITVDWDADF